MKKLIILSFIACSPLFLQSCSDDDSNISYECYSFDERQCGADPFTFNGNRIEKQNAIKNYFSNQGITTNRIEIIESFYNAVCEACFVCPESYRIFVQFQKDHVALLLDLDLFNLKQENCSEVFF